MPIEVAPNRIELSELSGGFAPDPEEGSLPLNQSPDVLNLLLDPGTLSAELRKGYSRLTAGRLDLAGFWIRHANYYEVVVSGTRKKYLVCILSNGASATNNVRVYVYDFAADTFTRVDTVGRQWNNPNAEHWYAVVEGTYYGGVRGDVIYSWHPTDGWDADPTTPTVDTWVDSITPGASQKARNYAFKKGMKVAFSGRYYSALRGIRFKTWESGERYNKGERVSRKAAIAGQTYWRSFECIKSHTSDAAKAPGDGADTATYWKTVRLKNIEDEDGDVTSDWAYMPLPGKGPVGVYHGNRLWVLHRDSDNHARLQYSAPAKPEKDSLISDLDFRPTDWAPVDDNQGDGGGWMTIPFTPGGDAIRGLRSYGSYLLVFGRWQTFVLAGTNEQTWTLRPVSNQGIISPGAHTEHKGIVYFLSPGGTLNRTDGTSSEEVPGMARVREWLKTRLDIIALTESVADRMPELESYQDYIFISLPDASGTDYTLVYHPDTASFWLLDLPILSMAVGHATKSNRLFFSTVITGAGSERPCLFVYKDDPGNEVYTDDDPNAATGSAATNDITWRYRTAWFQFGTTRNERRIRRAWALVAGEAAEVVEVKGFRRFNTTAVYTANRTLTGQATEQAEFVEGQSMQTTYATALQVGGTANAQLAVHGFGIDTERVRGRRFHK